jgi:hypothetical protein
MANWGEFSRKMATRSPGCSPRLCRNPAKRPTAESSSANVIARPLEVDGGSIGDAFRLAGEDGGQKLVG